MKLKLLCMKIKGRNDCSQPTSPASFLLTPLLNFADTDPQLCQVISYLSAFTSADPLSECSLSDYLGKPFKAKNEFISSSVKLSLTLHLKVHSAKHTILCF